jgi:hypothetical protein
MSLWRLKCRLLWWLTLGKESQLVHSGGSSVGHSGGSSVGHFGGLPVGHLQAHLYATLRLTCRSLWRLTLGQEAHLCHFGGSPVCHFEAHL